MNDKTFHIKKDDQVKVLTGKEKGKTGKILKVLYKKESAVVEKLNFVKRHTKAGGQNKQGGIMEKEAPIKMANLQVMCNKCNKPVRIKHKFLENNKKTRVCGKCGEILDKV